MITEKDIQNIARIQRRIKCFLHPLKAQMLFELKKPMSGGELDKRMGMEQSVCAQFRADLRAENLVTTTRKGKYIFYQENKDAIAELILMGDLASPNEVLRLESLALKARAINNPLRVQCLEAIAKKDWRLRQKDLVVIISREQSETAAQLKILVDAGFVLQKKEGKEVFYAVDKLELKHFLKIAKISEKWTTK